MIDDLDRIMAVMQAAFDPAYGEAWTRRQVEDALILGNCHYRLIGASGESPPGDGPAAGFSLSRHGFEEEELLLFAVAPDHRRKGLGGALLDLFLADCRNRGADRVFLEMRQGNPAEILYRSRGFRPVGLRKDYYRTSGGSRLDALTFVYDFPR